ncbi:disease resistance-like protein DSC1 [Humulus lupulus]|uniref:disease resistance-like protein DSC1 n=1 Tax=Humulus lupulus TaxID=3486 RepID=UPI002B415101|nr:disease resistance-like protein DSC1 [Humulus lupulus]
MILERAIKKKCHPFILLIIWDTEKVRNQSIILHNHASYLMTLSCGQIITAEPMECLKDLSLDGTGIIKLHSSIEKLIGLRWLFLRDCKNLEFVPNNIFNMSGLEWLSLSKCSKLESLPAVSSVGFHFKIEINLSHNSLLKLSDWIYGLSSIPMLDSCGSMSDMRPVNFLGFAFCIVVEFEHYCFDLNRLNCRYEYVSKPAMAKAVDGVGALRGYKRLKGMN